jgi:hypothetical protein
MLIPEEKNDRTIEARQTGSGESDTRMSSSLLPMVNVISAQVAAIHRGMIRVGIRLRVGERTDLAVRLPLSHCLTNDLSAGQWVRALIPAEAVQLEAGYFRQGKRRWNRWIGRIVLVDSVQGERVATVTLHNDQITLKSCGLMIGSNWVPQAWDTVNIVVDPTNITLDTLPRISSSSVLSRNGEKNNPVSDARVWLKGQITHIGHSQEGTLLSLLIGSAHVSVFIDQEDDDFRRWTSGMAVEIHVDQYDAWLKPRGHDRSAIFCGILYLDHHSASGAR